MVELRQRVQPGTKTPADESPKLNDASLLLRRSSRKLNIDFDDKKSNDGPRRIKASLIGDQYLTISGLAIDEFPDPSPSNELSDESIEATWEDRWLGSPMKRRKLARQGRITDTPPPEWDPRRDWIPDSVGRQKPVGTRTRSDDDNMRSSQGTPADPATSSLRRSGRAFSQTTRSKETSQSSTSAKSQRESAEPADEHVSGSRDQQNPRGNISSGHSTPMQARSPALSSIPSPTQRGHDGPNDNHEPAVTKDPNQLDDEDLPPAFLPLPLASTPGGFQDKAAYLLSKLYRPIPQPHRFIDAMSSHPPSSRSTQTLLELAINTQRALKAWQDEYILLDKKTAPVAIPIAKKPAMGGRVPIDPGQFEADKHKELYCEGSVLAKAMGIVQEHVGTKVHPTGTSTTENGHSNGAGRELRRRRGDAGIIDGLGISSDDAGGRGSGKRTRRPARRFEIGQNGQDGSEAETVPTRGMGGRRRRGGARGLHDGGRDHEQSRLMKRGRIGALLREESADASSMSATPETEDDRRRDSGDYTNSRHDLYGSQVGPRGGRSAAARRRSRGNSLVAAASATTTKSTDIPPSSSSVGAGPSTRGGGRQKAKSEKRSESMTLWWAARKRKAAEEKIRQMRERGEIHGPSEGIMDTSAPIASSQRKPSTSATTSYGPTSASTGGYRYSNVPNAVPAPLKRELSWQQPQLHTAPPSHMQGPRGGYGSPFAPGPPQAQAQAQVQPLSPYARPDPSSWANPLANAPPPPSQRREDASRMSAQYGPPHYGPGSGMAPQYQQPHSPYGQPQQHGQQQLPPLHPGSNYLPPPPSSQHSLQHQQGYFQVPWGARYPRY